DATERTAEDRIRLAKQIARRRILRREVAAHSDGLRALPGEEECDAFCHAPAYCKRGRARKTACASFSLQIFISIRCATSITEGRGDPEEVTRKIRNAPPLVVKRCA